MIDITKSRALLDAQKAFVLTLPEDLSSYPDQGDFEANLPNFIVYKKKIIPVNWDGTTMTLAS